MKHCGILSTATYVWLFSGKSCDTNNQNTSDCNYTLPLFASCLADICLHCFL